MLHLKILFVMCTLVAALIRADSSSYGNFQLPFKVIPPDANSIRPSTTVAHDHYSCRRHPHFNCLTVNFCVAPALVLDGVADCADGSDEDVSLVNECELGPDAQPAGFRCAAAAGASICVDTQLGYQCLCAPGYTGNGFVCAATPPPVIQRVDFSFNRQPAKNGTITVNENTPVNFVVQIKLKADNNNTDNKDINFNGFVKFGNVSTGAVLDKGVVDLNDNTTWIIPREAWQLENNGSDENISFRVETKLTAPQNWASNISSNIEVVINRGEFTRRAASVRPLRIQIRPVASVPILNVRPSCYVDPNQPDLRLNIRASTGSDLDGSETLAVIVDGLPAIVGIEPVIEKLDRDSVRLDANALHMARLIRPKTAPFTPFNLTVIAMTVEEANYDRKAVNATLVIEQCHNELGTMLNVQVGDGFPLPLRQAEPFSFILSLTASLPDERVQQAEIEISQLPIGSSIVMPKNHAPAIPLTETSWIIPITSEKNRPPHKLLTQNVTITLPSTFYGPLTLEIKGDVRYRNSYFSDAKKVQLEIIPTDPNYVRKAEEAPANLIVVSEPRCFLPETDENLVRLLVSVRPHLVDKHQHLVNLRETYTIYLRMPRNLHMADGRRPTTASDDRFLQYVISYDELERANNVLELPIELPTGEYSNNITFHFTLLTTDTNTFAQTFSFFNYDFVKCVREWQEEPKEEKVYHQENQPFSAQHALSDWPHSPPVLRPPYKHTAASFGGEISSQPGHRPSEEIVSQSFVGPTGYLPANFVHRDAKHAVAQQSLPLRNPPTSFFVQRQPNGYTAVHTNGGVRAEHLIGRRAELASTTFGTSAIPSETSSTKDVVPLQQNNAYADTIQQPIPEHDTPPSIPASAQQSDEIPTRRQWPPELLPFQFASKIGTKFVSNNPNTQHSVQAPPSVTMEANPNQKISSQQQTIVAHQIDNPNFVGLSPAALRLLKQINDQPNNNNKAQRHFYDQNPDDNAIQIHPIFKQKLAMNHLMKKTPPYGRPTTSVNFPRRETARSSPEAYGASPDVVLHDDNAIQQRALPSPIEFRPRLRPLTIRAGDPIFFKFDFTRRNFYSPVDVINGQPALNVIGELHLPNGYEVVSSQRAAADGHWSVAPGVDYEISSPADTGAGKQTIRFVGKAFPPATSSVTSNPIQTDEKRFEIQVQKDADNNQYGSNGEAELKIDKWPVCLQRFPLRLAWQLVMRDPESQRLEKLEVLLQKRDMSVVPSNYSSDLTHIYLPPPGVTSGILEIRSLWNNSIVATREPFNIEIKAYTVDAHQPSPERVSVDVFKPKPLPTCMDLALPQISAKRPPPLTDYNEVDVTQLSRSSLSPAAADAAVLSRKNGNAAVAQQPNSASTMKSIIYLASLAWLVFS